MFFDNYCATILQYKPRTQPGKCNLCSQRNVTAAYHTICNKCAASDKAILAMEKRQTVTTTTPPKSECGESTDAVSENSNLLVDECEKLEGALHAATINETSEPAASSATTTNETSNAASKRRIHVCAICTNEPALSKYSNVSGEHGDIIDQIDDLEDTLDTGVHKDDGHKLTVREIKGVERKIEKLQLELKVRRKKVADEDEEEEEEGGEGSDTAGGEDEGEEIDDDELSAEGEEQVGSHDDSDDPFLMATGGKALVGEDYQNMLLAREK